LKGKFVKKIRRHRKEEVVIEFEDGASFYIDWREDE
jgi:S-formylglutathione hydrolase FrmB